MAPASIEQGVTKFGSNFSGVLTGLKQGNNFAEGAMFVAKAVAQYADEFPASTVFEFTTQTAASGVRRVDVRVGNIFYEFKSVLNAPPSGFADQFIKDMDLPEITDLSQIKWWFDREKIAALTKQDFLDELNAATIDPRIIRKLLPATPNPTKANLLAKISQDFDLIFAVK